LHLKNRKRPFSVKKPRRIRASFPDPVFVYEGEEMESDGKKEGFFLFAGE
jgi:hypothetical protein